MARNVFVSFRYADGHEYKERLCKLFDSNDDTIDFSEDEDRSKYTEDTIKKYLYSKLKRSSVTIVILTPEAINHRKNWRGQYDDWMYDEIRYSLEDREDNKTNGLIAVYTKEAAAELVIPHEYYTEVKNFDNLCRDNMFNVKPQYKICSDPLMYNSCYDCYCTLVSLEEFEKNITDYIDMAVEKRNALEKYNLVKRKQ